MSGYFAGCTGYTYAYGSGLGGLTHAAWTQPGGTGSIYPSEYGVHNYDQYSGTRGFTSSVYSRDYAIPDVSLNDTFESWRNLTNDQIIEKLNLLKVYGATHGDGIMIANSTGGTLAVAFSGNVLRTHTTFCNNVSVEKTLKVGGVLIPAPAAGEDGGPPQGSVTTGYNFSEKLLILNTEDNKIGCDFSGIIVGGGVTGPNPTSIDNSDGGDKDNAFAFDRPYLLHQNSLWRTKEGMWFEGELNHSCIFGGRTFCGGTGEDYPYGPYGYTGCGLTYSNSPATGGVVRWYFGPTLGTYNYLDIDGRNGVAGKTGYAWHNPFEPAEIGGATGALVLSNAGGPLLEFDGSQDGDFGFTNIYRGANRKRIIKNNHGFVLGNVLRYSGVTQGYTYASAAGKYELHGDGTRAAEVIGVVSKVVDFRTFDVTFMGEVLGTKSEWNSALVENHTEGLIPGCVYYLSQHGKASRGKLQHAIPANVGYVSRPVLVATGKTSGIVMPFTGQYLSPTGCSGGNGNGSISGNSGNDATFFEVGYDKDSTAFSQGDVVCVNAEKTGGIDFADISKGGDFIQPFGVVYDVNADGDVATIATSGTITFPGPFKLPSIGTYYLSEEGKLIQKPSSIALKVLDAISPSTIILNIQDAGFIDGGEKRYGSNQKRGSQEGKPGIQGPILGPTGATGHTFDNSLQVNENLLRNPNFGLWQRGIGTTSAHTGINNTYFADRWVRLTQTGTGGFYGNNPYTGKSAGTHRTIDTRLERGSFNKKQTKVEGHPDFYAVVKGAITYHGGTQSYEYSKVEQRIQDSTSFAGNIMTASFYCRASGGTGNCHVAWIQNLTGKTGPVPGSTLGGIYSLTSNNAGTSAAYGITASEIITPITDFTVGTDWSRYAFSFIAPEVSDAAGASGANYTPSRGPSADHFASLSFFTQLTSLPDGTHKNINFPHELHLSQVKLEKGNVSTTFNYVDYYKEFTECSRYYQTSYVDGIPVGTDTMRNRSQPDTSGVNFFVPGNYLYIHELPVRMRKVPICSLWSPTGIPEEGFNRDAGQDMRFSAGTRGHINNELRTGASNSKNISCFTDTPNAIEIRVHRGASKLDTITVHYRVDAELNDGFPEHPTTT
jgi:hypothetical protein